MRSHPKHIVAVGCLVRNDDDKVLLVRSPRRGWEFPGGQVEEGEDLIAAVEREVVEETGVQIQAAALVGVYSNLKPPVKLMLDFVARYRGGSLQPSAESPDLGWHTAEEVVSMVSHPAILDRLRTMLAFSGAVTYRAYELDPYVVHRDLTLDTGRTTA